MTVNYISSFDTGRVPAQKQSMTDSDDAVVTEIIREIVKHGASAGVTFRQTVGGSTPARYPTERSVLSMFPNFIALNLADRRRGTDRRGARLAGAIGRPIGPVGDCRAAGRLA